MAGTNDTGGSGGSVDSFPCPDEPPTLAAGCPIEGQICAYTGAKQGPCSDVGFSDRVAWRCELGRWLEVAHCADREGCPESVPAQGTPCSPTWHGLDCFYSADRCEPRSLAQCAGSGWRWRNDCGQRSLAEGCLLTGTLSQNAELRAEHGSQHVSSPEAAFAGTQMSLALSLSGGSEPDHAIHGALLQTAAPKQHSVFTPDALSLLGRDAITSPRLAFARDRFVLGWGANDGWPVHVNGQPGSFVRSWPLHSSPQTDRLVDADGYGFFSVTMSPQLGAVIYAKPTAIGELTKQAVLMELDGSDIPQPATALVLSDETAGGGMIPPVPNAVARVVTRGEGFAVGATVPATGDFWDDSGVALWLGDELPSSGAPPTARITGAGAPRTFAMVALRDGTVIVAAKYYKDDLSGPPFMLYRLRPDGTVLELPPPPDHGQLSDSSPRLVALDDGFAMAWLSYPAESPGPVSVLRVAVRAADGQPAPHFADYERTVVGMWPSNDFDLFGAPVDSTLHLLWATFAEQTGPSSLDRIFHQRLICEPSLMD